MNFWLLYVQQVEERVMCGERERVCVCGGQCELDEPTEAAAHC